MPQTIKAPPVTDPQILTTRPNSVGLPSRLPWSVVIGACVLLVVFVASDLPAWKWMFEAWMTKPDDSHGILVPVFSAWLLWHRRAQMPASGQSTSWLAMAFGVACIILGIGLRCSGIYTRTISMEAASLLPCILGIVLCVGGFAAIRWAWPAVLFLVFMIPLPAMLGGLLGGALQKIATICSTYVLQTIGIPAVSEGNVIYLTEKSLGVAEACSGIRMLTSFFALAVGVSLVIDREVWRKCVIVVSAPLIAIVANVLRISGTAIAYEFGNEKMAEMIFHDLAGWLMMPAGLMLLWLELFVLSRLFEDVEKEPINFGSLK